MMVRRLCFDIYTEDDKAQCGKCKLISYSSHTVLRKLARHEYSHRLQESENQSPLLI
jgi:hypothetical protein